MIVHHQKLCRTGWSIPHSMEWIFWPLGLDRLGKAATDSSVMRRFRIANEAEFLPVLNSLVKPLKP